MKKLFSRLRVCVSIPLVALASAPLIVKERESDKTNESKLVMPAFADRVKGGYDTRIREFSTPEKVFDAFASIDCGGGLRLMTWDDFRRSILPYDCRSKSEKKKLKKRPQFLVDLVENVEKSDLLSDPDDDFISLGPFLFIDNLLSIPPSEWALAFAMFDEDENGLMSEREFAHLLKHFRVESFSAYDYSFISPLFRAQFATSKGGKGGGKELSMKEFEQFLNALRVAILEMEFDSYTDEGKKEMAAPDFCMSLVGYADHRQIPWYMARIRRMPAELSRIRISLDEFVQFNLALNHLDEIMRALKIHSACTDAVSKKMFARAVRCVTGQVISDDMGRLLFWLFDQNGDSLLDYAEIGHVLEKRFSYGNRKSRTFGFTKYLSCFYQCLHE